MNDQQRREDAKRMPPNWGGHSCQIRPAGSGGGRGVAGFGPGGTRDPRRPLGRLRPVFRKKTEGALRPAGRDCPAPTKPGHRFPASCCVAGHRRDAPPGVPGEEVAEPDELPCRVIHCTKSCHSGHAPSSEERTNMSVVTLIPPLRRVSLIDTRPNPPPPGATMIFGVS